MERSATPIGPIGFVLPTFPQDTPLPGATRSGPGPEFDPVAALSSICREAERLGAGALWACDHLFWHGPTFECLTTLTLAATATARTMVGTCVLQLPLRRPNVVAKQVATLQTLSRGRVILGVGVGMHAEEYERAGVDYHTRGRRLDAGIDELHRSWSAGRQPPEDAANEPSSAYRQLPEPPAVPVWIGGSSVAARRRAAHLGDGWLPLFVEPARYRADLDRLTDDVAAAGRPVGSVTPAIVLFVSVDDDRTTALRRGTSWLSRMYRIPAKAFERHLVSGTPDEVAERVTTYRETGAEHVALYVTDDEPLDQFEALIGALSAAGVPSPL